MTAMGIADFDPALKRKEAYRFFASDQVRFTDLDALGHVSAVRTNEYFNSARALLFKQAIDEWPHATQLPVLKLAIVLYEKEVHFPQALKVGLVIEKWGTSSVTMVLGAFAEDECVALSRNVFVFIDAQTRKPVALSVTLKQNFVRLAQPEAAE